MVFRGLGKVLSGTCGEVAWSGQTLAVSGSSSVQGHLYLCRPRCQPKEKSSLSFHRKAGESLRLTSPRHSSEVFDAFPF